MPPAVVRHVRDALGLAGNVELEQAAERTAKRYRELVRARMKVTYDTARVRQVAEQAIRKAVQAKDNPADLINVALEELVRARCERTLVLVGTFVAYPRIDRGGPRSGPSAGATSGRPRPQSTEPPRSPPSLPALFCCNSRPRYQGCW